MNKANKIHGEIPEEVEAVPVKSPRETPKRI